MAKNISNNRIPVKWVRDRAKSAYQKKDSCDICGSVTDLELHHLHSITILLDKWARENGYDISTDEGILAVRDEFIEQHHTQIYKQVVTLCNKHHVALHSVYGKAPSSASVPNQEVWIEKQKAKIEGREPSVPIDEVNKPRKLGTFSAFY